jgi:hypothetical protein
MKKLALKLESLSVESFNTSADAESPRGTVQAAEDTFFLPCQASGGGTCHIGWSCWGGCQMPILK